MSKPSANSAIAVLVADNRRSLETLARVLATLDATQYTATTAACERGIGTHVRHILDHYDALFAAKQTSHIDYDARERDTRTESDRDAALARIARTRDRLESIDDDAAVTVTMDCGSSGSTALKVTSTLSRELQFLVSHTVHHETLIATAARALGVAISADFGVAPSTLRHAGVALA